MNLSRSIFVLLLTLPSIGRSSQHTANLVDRLFTVYNHQTVALKDENDGRNFSYQQAQRWYNIAPFNSKAARIVSQQYSLAYPQVHIILEQAIQAQMNTAQQSLRLLNVRSRL